MTVAEQLSLDAPVRVADPDTSAAAAASVEQSSVNDRALVLDALRARPGHRGTADEVTDQLNAAGDRRWQRNCVSSRLSQLRNRGLVADTGERGTGATGRPTIVFEVTR